MPDLVPKVQKIYEAFGRGDIPSILVVVSDRVEWERWSENRAQAAGVPWLMERKGKEGVLEFFRVVGQFHIHDFRVLSLMAGGNQVVAEVTIDTTVPTGKRYQDEELHLWSFDDDGKVVRFRHYVDTAKHISAAKS